MMWGYGFGWGWVMMGFGMILWIALLVVLVWALLRWLDRSANGARPQGPATPAHGPSALEILQQRYARGEIDATTFEQMRERIEASAARETSSSRR